MLIPSKKRTQNMQQIKYANIVFYFIYVIAGKNKLLEFCVIKLGYLFYIQ